MATSYSRAEAEAGDQVPIGHNVSVEVQRRAVLNAAGEILGLGVVQLQTELKPVRWLSRECHVALINQSIVERR